MSCVISDLHRNDRPLICCGAFPQRSPPFRKILGLNKDWRNRELDETRQSSVGPKLKDWLSFDSLLW